MTTPAGTAMTCPKCHGQMNSYERNGVTVDQCTECRGVFLDRGELERLIDAEAAYTSAPVPPQQAEYRHHDDDDHYRQSYRGQDKHSRRRGGFLSEMFD